MTRAHSFDVFDTLLIRTHARPIDVLGAAAQRVVPGGPDDRNGRPELVAEIVARRRDAEVDAMRRLSADAVALDAIYAELGDLRQLGVDPDALRAAELSVEEEHVRPVRAGRERVEAARALGRRVLFVSDMYLPSEHIRASLERFGIAGPGEAVYVSGELGVSKRTGRLFEHVLDREGLDRSELVHTGDDPVTDRSAPAALGIAVEPLTGARLNRFERDLLALSAARRDITARVVGACRAGRVTHAPQDDPLAHGAAIGGDVAGPLFASFAAWALRTAREEGIERLYFVARDGEILLRVARELARSGDPECRYLHGSRQAWLLAGVDRVDRDTLHWLLEPDAGSPRALLAKLAIAPGEVEGAMRAHGLEPDRIAEGAALDRFWAMLETIAPLVLERASAARGIAAEYFEQEGLRPGGKWALVDLGWRLTTQESVRRILGDPGGAGAMGLYFGVNRRRRRLAQTGPFRAFLIEDDEVGSGHLPEAWVWNNTPLVEQVLAMPRHGMCTGYRRDGAAVVPVLAGHRSDAAHDAMREVIHGAVLSCAAELRDAGLLGEHLHDVRAAGLLAGRLAIERPVPDEAAALGWLRVTDDQNETRSRELAPPLTLGDVWLRTREKLGRPVQLDFDTVSRWREGSLARATPSTRAAFHALRLARRAAVSLRAGTRAGAP